MEPAFAARIAAAIGSRPVRRRPLSGGCIAEIYRLDLADGGSVVAKLAAGTGDLALEAWMLRYLGERSSLPVPAVLHAEPDLLVMEFIETSGGIDPAAERHAAELLAALHGVSAPRFGLERDTLIGPLPQPNGELASWRQFFAERRLLHMAREAHAAGHLPAQLVAQAETLAGRLERWIDEPAAPSLIHGDMWGGNVLTRAGRIAAFVDPAIYYADAEIELAFATLFSTFGKPFFDRYRDLRPIRPGFFEARRDLYNLYPLLVHARLFGGGYASQVAATLTRFVG